MLALILLIIVATPFLWAAYWVGRGVALNRALAGYAATQDLPDDTPEDTLVNLRTGEVIEPGSRRYNKAAKKATHVRFE